MIDIYFAMAWDHTSLYDFFSILQMGGGGDSRQVKHLDQHCTKANKLVNELEEE